ncbi:hypothetical protein GGP98_000488 [Salinibacter ruber]|nr:hypothetical protein [Salinibacter ruber]
MALWRAGGGADRASSCVDWGRNRNVRGGPPGAAGAPLQCAGRHGGGPHARRRGASGARPWVGPRGVAGTAGPEAHPAQQAAAADASRRALGARAIPPHSPGWGNGCADEQSNLWLLVEWQLGTDLHAIQLRLARGPTSTGSSPVR